MALSVVWLSQGFEVLSVLALALVPTALAVGDKFELDTAKRRYRAGVHWANVLNPGWQQLPAVQAVVVKPYSYRSLQPTRFNGTSYEGVRHGFTVLLSVPHARQGIVVASVEDEAQAVEIATAVADALQVPWQRA